MGRPPREPHSYQRKPILEVDPGGILLLFQRIVSEGLSHYSYIIGDKREALVIDPRRDAGVYLEKAREEGMRIAHVFETHRNEDYLIGSLEIAPGMDAEVWHADSQFDYSYGRPVKDGQRWRAGSLEIEAIHAPGHTPGTMNYLLRDSDGVPWMVFTGDTLFAGDVGRIDLMGEERKEEMAGLLYDSIYERLLPLGDEVLVCPAHGAGSVCGEAISDRLWTTMGIERKHNPRLQHKNKDDFAADLVKSQPERPPYFSRMEELNLRGPPVLGSLPIPKPLSPREFEDRMRDAFVIDTRMELDFGAGHIPGVQFIWLQGLPGFEGWYVPYDRPVLLVTDDPETATRYLIREGYDRLEGFLAGGMLAWHMAGKESARIRNPTVQEVCREMKGGKEGEEGGRPAILDVRSDDELEEAGRVPGALHIHVTRIPERYREVPKEGEMDVFCGSGLRSTVAASFLQNRGWENLGVIPGGMAGWKAAGCPVQK